MTTKGFSLAEFSPEPMTFTDDGFGGDGRVYDAKTLQHLGARDTVRMQQLYERMSNALTAGGDGDADVLATQLEQTVDDLFALLIPTLPTERHQAIPFQGKFRFLNWWRSEQTPPASQTSPQEGEVAVDPKPKKARRKVAKKDVPASPQPLRD
jgi:hypothetical protein